MLGKLFKNIENFGTFWAWDRGGIRKFFSWIHFKTTSLKNEKIAKGEKNNWSIWYLLLLFTKTNSRRLIVTANFSFVLRATQIYSDQSASRIWKVVTHYFPRWVIICTSLNLKIWGNLELKFLAVVNRPYQKLRFQQNF